MLKGNIFDSTICEKKKKKKEKRVNRNQPSNVSAFKK